MHHTIEDLHKLSRLKGSMQELYHSLAFRTFAFSITGVFLPIYFISIGFSLSTIALFFAFMFLYVGFFSVFSALIAERIGLKNVVLLSIPFSTTFFVMLYLLGEGSSIPLALVALFGGMGETLYFTALNIDFAVNSKHEHHGHEVGSLDSFFKSSGVLGPVLGAFVIVAFGFELLFGLAIIVLVLSLFALYNFRPYRDSFVFDFRKVFVLSNLRHFIVFACYGVFSAAEWFLWPLFIYLLFADFYAVGLAVALVGLGSAFFLMFFRKVSLRFSPAFFARIGAVVYAVVWLLRAFSLSFYDAMLLSFLAGFVIVLVHVPFFTDTHLRAREKGVAEFIVFREAAVCLGRVVFFLLVFGFGTALIDPYMAGFLVAGVASLLFLAG